MVESETNEISKKFITNIIFGQKLINSLSLEKRNTINIDVFLNHIKNFNKQNNEKWLEKINFDKYCESIPSDIENKLVNDSNIIIKNMNNIEPYCKKTIKIMTPMIIFKKNAFHYKLIKLESTYYDLMGVLYYKEKIVGYICCGKKSNTQYKNLYVVICKKYDNDFFNNLDKKIISLSEISEELNFYEKNSYINYYKNFRSQIFSFVYEILGENKSIQNIICIGEEEGGNFLQLFTYDFLNNKDQINIKLDISIYLFTLNTSKLSTDIFYTDLIRILDDNSIITCFEKNNPSFNTWEVENSDIQKSNMNIILI